MNDMNESKQSLHLVQPVQPWSRPPSLPAWLTGTIPVNHQSSGFDRVLLEKPTTYDNPEPTLLGLLKVERWEKSLLKVISLIPAPLSFNKKQSSPVGFRLVCIDSHCSRHSAASMLGAEPTELWEPCFFQGLAVHKANLIDSHALDIYAEPWLPKSNNRKIVYVLYLAHG